MSVLPYRLAIGPYAHLQISEAEPGEYYTDTPEYEIRLSAPSNDEHFVMEELDTIASRDQIRALNILTEAILHPESVAAKRVRDGRLAELAPYSAPGARSSRRYTTGTGQRLTNVHVESDDCKEYGCPIHSPSDHSMVDFPTHWRQDRALMERICPHGVGHPDPDHISRTQRIHGEDAAYTEGVHGCDGCCSGRYPLPEPATARAWPDENVRTGGTSLKGYVDTTYDGLVAAFGEPNVDEGDGDKVDAEWVLNTPDGTATVYNYKTGPNYLGAEGTPVTEITDWHIGGYDDAVVDHVQAEVERSSVA